MSSSARPKTALAEREVPAYRQQEFHERRNRYCVCVFVINEGLRFERQLSRMQSLQATVDIIVADGGTTDGSTNTDSLARSGYEHYL